MYYDTSTAFLLLTSKFMLICVNLEHYIITATEKNKKIKVDETIIAFSVLYNFFLLYYIFIEIHKLEMSYIYR